VAVIDLFDSHEPFGVAGGFPESFELHRAYPYGPTLAIEALWEELGIGDCLRSLSKRLKYRVSYELAQMYEALDMLFEHSEEIDKQVFFQTANLFNLKVDLIFYDTTTVSFSVDQEDEDEEGIRKFGHAKEGFWAPQGVVALAVTQEGFPVKS